MPINMFDNDTPGNPAPGPGAPPPPGLPEFGTVFKPWETIDSSYSQDQWRAWEPSRSADCPPDRPYKAERTDASGNPITTCVEKPVDCPPGSAAWGDKMCLPEGDPRLGGRTGSGGGRRGAGVGTGGGVGSSLGLLGLGGDTSSLINGALSKIIGGETRFSPEVMADITAGQKLQQQGRIRSETAAAREDAARRGTVFSPLAGEQERLIRAEAASEFDEGQRNLRIQKATTDFTDKMQALAAQQQWLNSLRQYALGLDSNDVQRQKIAADLELGYASIAAQMDRLLLELEANKEMQQAELDSNEWAQINKWILCIQFGNC